jgi:hypothetical protein
MFRCLVPSGLPASISGPGTGVVLRVVGGAFEVRHRQEHEQFPRLRTTARRDSLRLLQATTYSWVSLIMGRLLAASLQGGPLATSLASRTDALQGARCRTLTTELPSVRMPITKRKKRTSNDHLVGPTFPVRLACPPGTEAYLPPAASKEIASCGHPLCSAP